MKKTNQISYWAGGLLLIIAIGLCILPFLYMLLMSVKSTTNAYDIKFFIEDLTLQHYQKIFSNPVFLRYLLNSVIVSICGVALTLVVSCLAGYAFAKMNFIGNDKFFLLLVLTMLVPSEAILVPLYIVVRGLGWVNTFKALILPLPTAFGVFIMRQAILGLPNELLESARMDGASDLRILWSVVLPLVHSSMITLAIFTFVGSWNNFAWPLIITTKDYMRTLPLALTTMEAQYDVDVGLKMASATITFLPPFLVYLFLQSRFKIGMALSGLKG
ncbi:MAG: carbohydrate ABC transporter permease [Eubacteriales bacterium]|nr:carbohydrate ABC transporter permease [Eubacteriales bacterium]